MTMADQAVATFREDFICSQAVAAAYAEELGVRRDAADILGEIL